VQNLKGDTMKLDNKSMLDYCNKISKEYAEIVSGNCNIKVKKFPGGVLEGYLHTKIYGKFDVPVFSIDGVVFMSTTPMEVESHIIHIEEAKGDVIVGGLGMGYYISKIIKKPEVTSVTIIEQNKAVIAMYEKLMETNKDFFYSDKIKIIHADLVTYESEQVFDYAYFDIWATLDTEEISEDFNNIVLENKIQSKRYGFWGMTKWLYEEMIDMPISFDMQDILKLKLSETFSGELDWAYTSMFRLGKEIDANIEY